MSNLLRKGSEFQSEKRHAHMTESVVYRRGDDSVPVSATPGRPRGDEAEVSDFIIDADRVDWIMRKQDLILNGQSVDPAVDDEIEFVNGDKTSRYIVRRDAADKCWVYVDEYRIDIRVHTIQKGES